MSNEKSRGDTPQKGEAAIADQQLAEGKSQTDPNSDPRHITMGREIPTEFYADQPYIVHTDDGAWLCVLTTGAGREGQSGQHVVSLRSTDRGRTWEEPVKIEHPDGPEASWVVAHKAPSGRIFAFYIHNTDNIRELKADNPPYSTGYTRRMDSFGYYVFKFSDDHGRSWSRERYTIPVREFEIDRNNVYKGSIRLFWNVGKPFDWDGVFYLPLHKVGGLGYGWFTSSEGALLRCKNLFTEKDPEKFEWETLPEGDIGLRTPPGGGPVAEEQSFTHLSDGTFFCVYRTIDGFPACTYSGDQGRTWTEPVYMTFADGRRMKNPRAANFAWRCENGNFLYWFHHHGGRHIGELPDPERRTRAYQDRNPAWLSGGVEVDTPEGKRIQWSEPEIVIYDDDTYVRMSYPDMIEDNGKVYISETQKFIARVHEMDNELLEGMWNSFDRSELTDDGLLLNLGGREMIPESVAAPRIPHFTERDNERHDYGTRDLRTGFTLDAWVRLDTLSPGQVVLDARDETGKGYALLTSQRDTLELILNDGRAENRWDCDPGCLKAGESHHVAVIVDGGPKIITFVMDGKVCDGGNFRQYGWGRYSPHLKDINGDHTLRLSRILKSLRIYGRAIRNAEARGNYLADLNT